MTETETRSEWDQLSIETPELVSIEMPVAGLGSRFAALLVDYLIWLVVLVGLFILIAVLDPSLNQVSTLGVKWATAIWIFLFFLLRWGYFTVFEAFWNGRTPGKRVAGIRVIQRTGRGIGLFESMTRNLLRLVDELPFFYVVGVISILVTRDHQRLGDLAAGTLVVHERRNPAEASSISSGRTFTAGMFAAQAPANERRPGVLDAASGSIQKLDARDLEVLEGFFARRLDLNLETRAGLSERIAAGIRAKAGLEIPEGMSTETFLEEVARQLRDLARLG
jgi:uncharacterized RDD family membrane protein YckC